jgi:hypothetical protein
MKRSLLCSLLITVAIGCEVEGSPDVQHPEVAPLSYEGDLLDDVILEPGHHLRIVGLSDGHVVLSEVGDDPTKSLLGRQQPVDLMTFYMALNIPKNPTVVERLRIAQSLPLAAQTVGNEDVPPGGVLLPNDEPTEPEGELLANGNFVSTQPGIGVQETFSRAFCQPQESWSNVSCWFNKTTKVQDGPNTLLVESRSIVAHAGTTGRVNQVLGEYGCGTRILGVCFQWGYVQKVSQAVLPNQFGFIWTTFNDVVYIATPSGGASFHQAGWLLRR